MVRPIIRARRISPCSPVLLPRSLAPLLPRSLARPHSPTIHSGPRTSAPLAGWNRSISASACSQQVTVDAGRIPALRLDFAGPIFLIRTCAKSHNGLLDRFGLETISKRGSLLLMDRLQEMNRKWTMNLLA